MGSREPSDRNRSERDRSSREPSDRNRSKRDRSRRQSSGRGESGRKRVERRARPEPKRARVDEWSEFDEDIRIVDTARDMSRSTRRRGRRKKGKDTVVTTIMLIICIVVFCVAGYQLWGIMSEYKAGTDSYKTVLELAIDIPVVETDEDGEEVELSYEYYYVDFDALLAENPEIVAWIRFDAPEIISYPVMQTDDNSTYLTTTFDGTANSAGAIFMDKDNSATFMSDNTVIYGHNMKNDSMFGALNEYNSSEFYEEHPYFYIYTPDGKVSKYQVASASTVDAAGTDRYTINFSSDEVFQSYIDEMIRTSYYDTGAAIDTSSKIITLSTCTSSDDSRFIVQGVKVEEKSVVIPE